MKTKSFLISLLFLGQLVSAQSFSDYSPAPPFVGVRFSSVTFSDVDGNGYNDVVLTGIDSASNKSTKLYTNAGGIFTEDVTAPFADVSTGYGAFSDVDGDGDEDFLLVGQDSSNLKVAKLYTNNGGSFTEVAGTPFEGVAYASVAFSDVDGDGDDDVLIIGINASNVPTAKLYTNNGGVFTLVTGTPFVGVGAGSIAFSDIDGDGDEDVLLTGRTAALVPSTKLYKNNGGSFVEVTGTSFLNVWSGSAAFSDVDGDGDEDVLIVGTDSSMVETAKLYTNAGGTFTEVTGTPFTGAGLSAIAFSDVDKDGDEDVLIVGLSAGQKIAELYTNAGGTFTKVSGTPFAGVYGGVIAFSDVDGDSDEDVLITGVDNTNKPIAKLYANDFVTSVKDNLFTNQTLNLTIYPNPVKDENLRISYYSVETGFVTLKIFDMHGRLLKQQKESAIIGQQTIPVTVGTLPKGIYFVELSDKNNSSKAKFIIR